MTHFTNSIFSPTQPSLYLSSRHETILKARACCRNSSPIPTISFAATKLVEQEPLRRSGNYQPPNWDFNYVQKIKNKYAGERYIKRCLVLKEQVGMMLDEEVDSLTHLELIDDLQRLGLAYHFRDKIQSILRRVHEENYKANEQDLYAKALEFRLLRERGFDVSQEVFNCFKNESGKFEANLCKDIKGILQLYEASYLLKESESTLEMAREFTSKYLMDALDRGGVSEELVLLVEHALELPLHWRMPRLEARWFIDRYEKRADRNPTLLELAKLDFNIVQATHQVDLKYASRWWRSTHLAQKLTFARDRLVENFFWTIGIIFDPPQGYCRRMLTKLTALLTAIDDVYDIYGTLDELTLFTDAVERWDVQVMDQLPDYMKICYFAVFNAINEMAYDVMKEQGVHIIPYLQKWAVICNSYLQEAKWYHSGYVPKLQEYLENALISISAPVILVHAYFFVGNPSKRKLWNA